MADDRKIIIDSDGVCSGTMSFVSGHSVFSPSELDRFIIKESRKNPIAVINRLIREGKNHLLIDQLIAKYDLEEQFDAYLNQ